MADRKNLEDVRELLGRSKRELMQRYQAQGVGIGKQSPDDDGYVIVLYMESQRNVPAEPAEVEGIPLKFEVTGPIRLQSH
jgi:hypothetical protein